MQNIMMKLNKNLQLSNTFFSCIYMTYADYQQKKMLGRSRRPTVAKDSTTGAHRRWNYYKQRMYYILYKA